MKTVWIASLAVVFAAPAWGQSTIYKLVDESGRVTYSNKPMKGGVVVDLEPLTTIPSTPAGMLTTQKTVATPAVAIVTPVASVAPIASVDPQLQRRRDDARRRILEEEMEREEQSLGEARRALTEEQGNPQLIAAVRVAQQTVEPTPVQLAEFRANIDKASGRIRGLQSTVSEHEKNIEALKKELGALKP